MESGIVNGQTFSLAPGTRPVGTRPDVGTTSAMTNGTQQANGNALVLDYTTDFPELAKNDAASFAEPVKGWKPMPKIKSATVSVVFHLPSDERAAMNNSGAFGNSLSAEQERCNQIANETGTSIELSESRDGTLTVVVNGNRNKVDEARRRVVTELQQQAAREIKIPKEHHRTLIGREGKRLRELEEETDCRITVPRPQDKSDIIRITGPRDGIEKAAHRIIQISEQQSKLANEHIVVEREYWPWIRGPQNATLEELQATGARVNIPPPSTQNNVIVVSGEKEAVAMAVTRIRHIAETMKANAKTMKVQIPRAQHRYIIGPGGAGLADILKTTNVSVEVPPESADSDMITLRGEPSKIATALPLVYQKATSVITKELKCPAWLHRHIIGIKGAGIRAITQDHPKCQVDFEDNDNILLHGPPEDVQPVEQQLSTQINKMLKEMDIKVIKVPHEQHRFIIGKGGAVVNKMKDDYNVQITIPNPKTNSDEIKVEGPRQGVAQAVREISEMASRIENERTKDVLVEQRFHRLIIGQGGRGVAEIRGKYPGVQFTFPEQGRKSDVVQLRGPKDVVEACAKHLASLAKNLKEENYQQKVPIFKDFHRVIIGKNGANVKKIRDDTGCRIDLPDETSNDVAITVTGRKDAVEKAVAALQKIEAELAQIEQKEITIPQKLHGRMLGGGGRMISDISRECGGVNIRFPDAKSKDQDKVRLRGPKDDVARAEKLLLDLAKDREQSSFEDSLKFNPELRRFLIGPGGNNLRKLRESHHDVRVMVPRDGDDDMETIHIVGSNQEAVKAMRVELEKLLKAAAETIEITVKVEPQYHRHFILRGAAVLRGIQDDCGGCHISFPKAGSNDDTVTIKGSGEMVREAQRRIEQIVDDLKHQTTEYMSIANEHHRTFMTRYTQQLAEIERQCRVHIKFPDRNVRDNGTDNDATGGITAPDAVAITGRAEQIELARQKLKALIPTTIEVPVPFEMHRALIGKGGSEIRNFQQTHDVQLKIPAADEQQSIVYVSGTPEAIEAARADLEARVRDREAASYTCTVTVPPEYHSRIIGPRGANINQYRQKYNVNVNVPRGDHNNNDQITIQGIESKAHACREEIEKLVQELQSMHRHEIEVDSRCHPRLIGSRGKNIGKIMQDYDVEVRFPRNEDANPNLIVIMGKNEDAVLDCADHIKNIEEEFMQEYTDRFQYERQPEPEQQPQRKPQQVSIANAPWSVGSTDDFPTIGGDASTGANAAPSAGAWGRPR